MAAALSETFEKITEGCYANRDWSIVIERTDRGWTVNEHGEPKRSFDELEWAIEWTERWLRGEAR